MIIRRIILMLFMFLSALFFLHGRIPRGGMEVDWMKMFVLLLVAIGLLATPVFADDNATNVIEDENDTVLDEQLNLDENVTIDEGEVGSLPGDWDYGFKRFFENVDKFFTWDKAEKAKKHAKYGKLRSMEAHILSGKAQKLAAEGKDEEAENVLEQVEQLTEEQNEETENAQEQLEAAVEEGTADEEDVEEVETELRNSIVVLQRVYEKAPESAKDGLARALNNSISNYQRHLEKMEEKGLVKEEKKAKTNVRGNETEEDEDENVTAGKGVTEQNKTKEKEKNQTKSQDKVKGGKGNGNDEEEEEELEEEDEEELEEEEE